MNNDEILKGRFIKKTLTETGEDIIRAQNTVMSTSRTKSITNFSNVRNIPRTFTSTEDDLTFTFDTRHRFIDMSKRKSKTGVTNKKSHPIYNKIVFGHLNNIIRGLSFGYTNEIIEEMKKLED